MSLRLSGRVRDVERTMIRRIFDDAPPDAINLGLGEPDLPTPPSIGLAGIRGIVRGETGYTPTAGLLPLRRAVAGRYPEFASGAENVVITVGSQEAMFAACLSLVEPGDEILYPDPGYPAYPRVAGLIGARPVAYPLDRDRGFRIDADALLERLGERTGLVILCSPSNPTGACHRREELEGLLELLERRGIAWLSDEIYSGFTYEREFVSASGLGRRGGVVISGLSKDLSMTGWRVGWLVGPEEVVRRATAVHQYLVTCAPHVSQTAAVAAFTAKAESVRADRLRRFGQRRRLMAAELSRIPGVRFELPEGAFYFFVDVSAHGSSLELGRRILRRRKVVTIPGEAFGAGGAGFLRLSFAASSETIREGVRAIGEELSRG